MIKLTLHTGIMIICIIVQLLLSMTQFKNRPCSIVGNTKEFSKIALVSKADCLEIALAQNSTYYHYLRDYEDNPPLMDRIRMRAERHREK